MSAPRRGSRGLRPWHGYNDSVGRRRLISRGGTGTVPGQRPGPQGAGAAARPGAGSGSSRGTCGGEFRAIVSVIAAVCGDVLIIAAICGDVLVIAAICGDVLVIAAICGGRDAKPFTSIAMLQTQGCLTNTHHRHAADAQADADNAPCTTTPIRAFLFADAILGTTFFSEAAPQYFGRFDAVRRARARERANARTRAQTRAQARTHARTHARTRIQTHAQTRTHARTHARTNTRTNAQHARAHARARTHANKHAECTHA